MKYFDLGAVFVGGTLFTTDGASGIRGSEFAAPSTATYKDDPPGRLLRGHAAILGNEEERFVDITAMGSTLGSVLDLVGEFLAISNARTHALRQITDLHQEIGALRVYHGVSDSRPSPPGDNVVPPSTGQKIDEQFIAFKKEYDTYKSTHPSATIDEQVEHLLGKVFQRLDKIGSVILLQLARKKEGVDTVVLDAIEKAQFERLKDIDLNELRVGWTSSFVIPSDDPRVLVFINTFLDRLEKHRLEEKGPSENK